MLFQTPMCLFVLLNTKEDIWKNVLIKQISIPIDYHSRKNTYYGSQWGLRSVLRSFLGSTNSLRIKPQNKGNSCPLK